ncbi:MAG: UPF0182 family protein [Candidatus Nitronauta litoralis]|uniref:UPF0182 protein G3M70_08075 n=1 Tax=Candidatus Nitronauta litoralis TaxID=2705533 RepID=A0A7T0FZR3_9BACT|nr:MAG: UPF0182 family protein [Candidatus Nitronauta litoralis]
MEIKPPPPPRVKGPGKIWFLLAAIIVIALISADQIIEFYFDLLWFEQYGFLSVIWTMLGAQTGLGLLAGSAFFIITYGTLKTTYKKSAHLPVVLSDRVRRDAPFLQLMADNLKPLVLFIPLVLAIMTGLIFAQQWDVVMKFLNQVPFGKSDPIFEKDYSFYLFTLPLWSMAKGLAWQAFVVIAIGMTLIHFFKQHITFTTNGIVTYPEGRRALSWLFFFGFLFFAMDVYMRRFGLVVDGRTSVVTGVSYANDYGRLPAMGLAIIMSLIGAVVSVLNRNSTSLRRPIYILIGTIVVLVGGNGYSNLLQKFVVDPNELIKETPYIEHSIAGTRIGYGLDQVEENVLTGSNSLSRESIERNDVTIENIRLWDQEPLLDTLGQIQEIRTYYQFQSVDNDRYTINGRYQQTLLSPRELLSTNLPNRTWINEHLTFTHGYGVSLSPVNLMSPQGLPVLHIKDIPPRSSVDLQVTRPEIYYGELSNDHVFVNTGTKEFDYPEGEKNVYKNYEGSGGVEIGSWFRKLLLAARFKTMKILFSEDIKNDSRLLFYRNIKERVSKIAPFLKYDGDPYMVITDAGRLVWMVDAYTVSDRLPYSVRVRDTDMLGGTANYIRNSVKVTVDAYEGTITYYVADEKDPIIQTYRQVFPKMFRELKDMPADLRSHIRYPSDLFSLQTLVYTQYHMKTPQVFYNKEDEWDIPEIDAKKMQPYYTIMKLPGKEKEEYILMLPFTPKGKQNMAAWMVARSDGADYGKLVLYTFPKQKLIYGPSQIVARINQEAEISRQISMWDQRGSQVIQGNLLVIPIEESLIFVRPLYLKADTGKIPELKRVIVGYENKIAMEQTLEKALAKIFEGIQLKSPTIAPDSGTSSMPSDVGVDGVVLSQADYEKIKTFFDRAVSSQKKIDAAVSGYQQDLDALGQALSAAKPVKPTPPAPATEPIATESSPAKVQ